MKLIISILFVLYSFLLKAQNTFYNFDSTYRKQLNSEDFPYDFEFIKEANLISTFSQKEAKIRSLLYDAKFKMKDRALLAAYISSVYSERDIIPKALFYALKANEIYEGQPWDETKCLIDLQTGYLYDRLNYEEKAIQYLNRVQSDVSVTSFLAKLCLANTYSKSESNLVSEGKVLNDLLILTKKFEFIDKKNILNLLVNNAKKQNKNYSVQQWCGQLESEYEKALNEYKPIAFSSELYYLPLVVNEAKSTLMLEQCINFNNLGVVNDELGFSKQAEKYFLLSIDKLENIDKKGIEPEVYTNIGLTYANLKNYKNSEYYFLKAKTIFELRQNKEKIAFTLNLLAKNYLIESDFFKSEQFALKSLAISIPIKHYDNQAISYLILSEKENLQDNYLKSKEYYLEYLSALSNSKRLKNDGLLAKEKEKNSSLKLDEDVLLELNAERRLMLETVQFDLLSKQREQEILLLKQNGELKDNKLKTELLEKIKAQQLYENERQKLLTVKIYEEAKSRKREIEIAQLESRQFQNDLTILEKKNTVFEQSRKLQQTSIERQKEKQSFYERLAWIGATFTALVLLGLLLILRQFWLIRKKNKTLNSLSNSLTNANNTLFEQKSAIEQTNKQMVDSINYATRLQNAILPTVSDLKRNYVDGFYLGMAKDIVSGDFAFSKTMDDYEYTALGDCTGHGVPGAILSVFCYEEISRILDKDPLLNPSRVLQLLHDRFRSKLNLKSDLIMDGADILLLRKDLKTNQIMYSSARGKATIIRKGFCLDLLSDRLSVGDDMDKLLVRDYELEYEKGDLLFAYSDGLIDQQVSSDFMKIGKKRIQNTISGISGASLEQRADHMRVYFNTWKGDYVQTDDASVLMLQF
jgi:serine phosphatase RsbU (regulator of sigma subunit)